MPTTQQMEIVAAISLFQRLSYSSKDKKVSYKINFTLWDDTSHMEKYSKIHFFIYKISWFIFCLIVLNGDHMGSWICNYLCNQCLSPLKVWVWILLMARCTWYIYVIKFVSDLQHVGGFLQFPPPIKLTTTI